MSSSQYLCRKRHFRLKSLRNQDTCNMEFIYDNDKIISNWFKEWAIMFKKHPSLGVYKAIYNVYLIRKVAMTV